MYSNGDNKTMLDLIQNTYKVFISQIILKLL